MLFVVSLDDVYGTLNLSDINSKFHIIASSCLKTAVLYTRWSACSL